MTEHISIVGNVGTEPTVEKTSSGTTYTRIRVGCGQRVRDHETGEWRDGESNWYNVFAYGTLAENVIKCVSKGRRVVATGTLRVRRWERDERSGTSVDVTAEAIGLDLRWGKVTGFERTAGQRRRDAPGETSGTGAPWMPPGIDGPSPSHGDGDAARTEQEPTEPAEQAAERPAGEEMSAEPRQDSAVPTPF